MGYFRHECMVVSSERREDVQKAHEAASAIFNDAGMGSLVTGVVLHAINGGAAFMVAPDGSKEGWARSDAAARARSDLIQVLATMPINWALILLGGDDGEYRVLQSP